MQITANTNGLHEHDPGHFTVEASGIGLRPGEWPSTIETTLGNGLLFLAQRKEVRDGDLLWVEYWQGNGCIRLTVYND